MLEDIEVWQGIGMSRHTAFYRPNPGIGIDYLVECETLARWPPRAFVSVGIGAASALAQGVIGSPTTEMRVTA